MAGRPGTDDAVRTEPRDVKEWEYRDQASRRYGTQPDRESAIQVKTLPPKRNRKQNDDQTMKKDQLRIQIKYHTKEEFAPPRKTGTRNQIWPGEISIMQICNLSLVLRDDFHISKQDTQIECSPEG